MKKEKSIFRRVITHTFSQKGMMIFICLLLVLAVLFGQAIPLIRGYMVDFVILPSSDEYFTYFILVIAAVLILEALCMFGQRFFINKLSYIVMRELKKEVFSSLIKRDFEFFETHSHGDIMLRLSIAMRDLSKYVARNFTNLIFNIFQLVSVFIFMLSLNYILALIALATYVVIGVVILLFNKVLKKRSFAVKKLMYELNGILLEQITGFTFIQAYNRNYKTMQNFEETSKRFAEVRDKYYKPRFALHPVTDTIATIFVCIIFGFSLFLFTSGAFELGIVVAFLGFVTDSVMPIRNIAEEIAETIQVSSVGDNIAYLEDDKPVTERLEKIETDRPNIVFENMSNKHSYKGVILSDINLEIKFGETVLIQGAHGSGKSTMGMVLLGLYEPSKGKVFIGGKDIRKIDRKNLHEFIGFAGENPFMFTDTIFNNVHLAKPSATEEEVMEAIEISGLGRVTEKLKNGAGTVIDQNSNLSNGDKQLLALARLILKDSKIIVLDEVFLDVDMKVRKRYQEILSKLDKEKTIIYITGKKNINLEFDKEISFEKGEIIKISKKKKTVK